MSQSIDWGSHRVFLNHCPPGSFQQACKVLGLDPEGQGARPVAAVIIRRSAKGNEYGELSWLHVSHEGKVEAARLGRRGWYRARVEEIPGYARFRVADQAPELAAPIQAAQGPGGKAAVQVQGGQVEVHGQGGGQGGRPAGEPQEVHGPGLPKAEVDRIQAEGGAKGLRERVIQEGFGGSWTAQGKLQDFRDTLLCGYRVKDGQPIDAQGNPLQGGQEAQGEANGQGPEAQGPEAGEEGAEGDQEAQGFPDLPPAPRPPEAGRQPSLEELIRLIVRSELEPFAQGLGKWGSELEQRLAELAQVKVEAAAPKIEIRLPDPKTPNVEIEGHRHPAYPVILGMAAACGKVFLSGPAGSGKSTIGELVAKDLGRPFGFISVTAGMAEGHLGGRLLFDGSFVGTSFLDCYEKGGVFLLDEVDAADPNCLLFINSALANGHCSVPNRKDANIATKHEDFVLIAAANTWGSGSDYRYVGRAALDAAFLDRFVGLKVHVGYDEVLEQAFARELGTETLYEKLQVIRRNVDELEIEQVVSTRAIQHLGALRKAGLPEAQDDAGCLDLFFTGWSPEERAKAETGLAA